MEQEPVPQKKSDLLIVLIITIGFGTSFVGGFFVSKFLAGEKNVTTITPDDKKSVPIPRIESEEEIVDAGEGTAQESTKFTAGKFYYDDTIIMVSKNAPHRNIVATVTRVQQDQNYVQNTRVSFHDGSIWRRRITSQATSDSAIVSNNIVKSWNVKVDPSRVLREQVEGSLEIDAVSISFNSGPLQNELSIRSLPGYTKFMSQGMGTLTVDGVPYESYVLYTRIYSQNAREMQFYNQPFGVKTDWLAFWDQEGHFYHVDVTNVDNPTPTYQTHQIGIHADQNKTVSKTFNVGVERDSSNPPKNYTIQLRDPLNISLSLERTNELNKDTSGSFTWYLGNVEGKVSRDGKFIPGVGLIEYIYN